MKRNGFDIEIHSSRSRTCESNMIGGLARLLSIWQCRFNGVFLQKGSIHFYPNDAEKIKGILLSSALIVFEDKPWVMKRLAEKGMNVIGVLTPYNRMLRSERSVQWIDSFARGVEISAEKLLGKSWQCHKMEAASAKFLERIIVAGTLVRKLFKPIILHKENIIQSNNEGIVYAPNHRSTLDPLIIESILKQNVHWAALLRFFKGEDSIFNNSKNPILCRTTQYIFHRLRYFPIERKWDNPDANNMDSVKSMVLFLSNGYKIGIFAEGTTKRKQGSNFGEFDDSFLQLAKKTNAWVSPITLLWVDSEKKKNKVIINFGVPFKVKDMTIGEALDYFMKLQTMALEENYLEWKRRSGDC